MLYIINQTEYDTYLVRLEELIQVVSDETTTDPNYIELMKVGDLIWEYEQVHYPIARPSRWDVFKLRVYEFFHS